MMRLAAGLFAMMFVVSITNAADPNPETLNVSPEQADRAKKLVRQLSLDYYQERERAIHELKLMGRYARTALAAGQNDADAEVRYRCRTLLLEAEEDDFRVRAEAFLADKDCRYNHDLPGWNKFRLMAGDDRNSRQLFIDMVKKPQNRALLIGIQGPPPEIARGLSGLVGTPALVGVDRSKSAEEAITSRRDELSREVFLQMNQGKQMQTAAADAFLMMFVESQGSVPTPQAQYNYFQIYQQPFVREAIAKEGSAARKIAMNWLVTREDADLMIIQNFGFLNNWPVGKDTQIKIHMKTAKCQAVQVHLRAQSLCTVAQLTDRNSLPFLTSCFQEEGRIQIFGPGGGDLQLKDVALGLAVSLTNQRPNEYGMPYTNQGKFNWNSYRFGGSAKDMDKKRDEAFAKWRHWESQIHGVCSGMSAAIPVVDKKYPVPTEQEKETKKKEKEKDVVNEEN